MPDDEDAPEEPLELPELPDELAVPELEEASSCLPPHPVMAVAVAKRSAARVSGAPTRAGGVGDLPAHEAAQNGQTLSEART